MKKIFAVQCSIDQIQISSKLKSNYRSIPTSIRNSYLMELAPCKQYVEIK